jgi:hypothetical protein
MPSGESYIGFVFKGIKVIDDISKFNMLKNKVI